MKNRSLPRLSAIAVLALACAGAGATPARAELTDPAQIQTEAYINLQLGEESLDTGRLDEALAQYKAARDYYQQLAKDFPGWEPRVIQYRKTYCDNQIADIERRQAGGQPDELPELEPVPAEILPVETPAAEMPAAAPDRSAEVDYLKGRIASLEAELAEADTLQDEIDALSAANDKLRRELEAVRKNQADKAKGEQSELANLRAELADQEKQLEALQQNLAAKKQLDQALNDMEANLSDLRVQNARLDKEIKTLDKELDDAEARADQSEARTQEADARIRQAEAQAKQAEKELQRARDEIADLEKKLAALQHRPVPEKAEDEKPQAEAAPKTVEKPKEAPKAKEVVAVSPVKASVPPKPIPAGVLPADFIRRLLQGGDNETALATVQEARKSLPSDMNLVLIEGIALIRLQRYPEAATLLIGLAKNNPRNAEVHATLGAAMMGTGFYEEARQELLLAVKLDKNVGGEYYYNLAQLYALVEPFDLKLARRYYKQARDLGVPADPALEKALK